MLWRLYCLWLLRPRNISNSNLIKEWVWPVSLTVWYQDDNHKCENNSETIDSMRCMHAQSKPHACKVHNIYAWSITEERGIFQSMNERVLLRSLQTLAKWCNLRLVPKRHSIVHVHVTSLSLSLWFILLASCTFIIAYSIRNEGGRSGPFYHASFLSTYIFVHVIDSRGEGPWLKNSLQCLSVGALNICGVENLPFIVRLDTKNACVNYVLSFRSPPVLCLLTCR